MKYLNEFLNEQDKFPATFFIETRNGVENGLRSHFNPNQGWELDYDEQTKQFTASVDSKYGSLNIKGKVNGGTYTSNLKNEVMRVQNSIRNSSVYKKAIQKIGSKLDWSTKDLILTDTNYSWVSLNRDVSGLYSIIDSLGPVFNQVLRTFGIDDLKDTL